MATIIGPLMSVTAHGSIGSRLTFSDRKTGQQVRFQNRQVDVKSVAQEAQRSDFLEAVAGWNALTESEQQEFEDRSKELFLNMTGYNLYILEVLTGVIVVGNKIQSSDGKTYIITNDDYTIEMIQNEIKTLEMHDSGIIDLVKQSGCNVYRATSEQTIPTGTVTKVEFNNEKYDIQNEFDSTTNYRFTATKAGKYLITVGLGYIYITDGSRCQIHVKVNGGLVALSQFHASYTELLYIPVSKVIDLAAGDYIEIYAYQDTGGNINLKDTDYATYLTISKIQ